MKDDGGNGDACAVCCVLLQSLRLSLRVVALAPSSRKLCWDPPSEQRTGSTNTTSKQGRGVCKVAQLFNQQVDVVDSF
jgi:hypothetical protein